MSQILPPGTRMKSKIPINHNAFLTGENGAVWATYDPRQAEILHNALLAQDIGNVISELEINGSHIYLLTISDESEISEAMDFIWRGEGGLRLKPDWTYGHDEPNASFEAWVNGY